MAGTEIANEELAFGNSVKTSGSFPTAQPQEKGQAGGRQRRGPALGQQPSSDRDRTRVGPRTPAEGRDTGQTRS